MDPGKDGERAQPQAALDLAHAYAEAADHLFAEHRNSKSTLNLPARLCALHAIELYLHAFLRFRGATAGQMRARHHDVWHEEFCHRLDLDPKTRKHLQDLATERVYLTLRYPSENSLKLCPLNRMERTLAAIREKTDRIPFHL